MDKSIQISLLTIQSPRFKPWALKMRDIMQSLLLTPCNNNILP